jgi:hypothetical protein
MSNNYKSEGFGMQTSEYDLSRLSVKSTVVFIQSLGVLAQSSYLLAPSIEKSIQLVDV